MSAQQGNFGSNVGGIVSASMSSSMSAQQGNFGSNVGGGKKAVHVKWAGKTIALGTFPAGEADEKCARAKALTRAWRSTMRPKPTREWVMQELERLGVRVVSGRLGRKAGEEDNSEKKTAVAAANASGGPSINRSNSLGWSSADADLNSLMQRRSSSIGLAMLNDSDLQRRQSLGSLGQAVGLDGNDSSIPPHRPLVGGGAAAAFEAKRADFYAQQNAQQHRRASSLGLGNIGGNLGSSGMSGMGGLSVNPNQHYEMLKLHHMNLLNEIQETTLMMNLYQQQQLQQQQQQLQQQANAEQMNHSDSQMALLLQQQQQQQNSGSSNSNLDQIFGGGGRNQQRNSIGLGGTGSGGQNNQMEQLLRQQQHLLQGNSSNSNTTSAQQLEILKGQQEEAALDNRLKKLKEDIARREKEAEDLQKAASARAGNAGGDVGDKRKRDEDSGGGGIGESGPKHIKLEDNGKEENDITDV